MKVSKEGQLFLSVGGRVHTMYWRLLKFHESTLCSIKWVTNNGFNNILLFFRYLSVRVFSCDLARFFCTYEYTYSYATFRVLKRNNFLRIGKIINNKQNNNN